MLKRTLSAITAIVIGTSGLSATDKSVSVSIDPDAGAKKGVIVVQTNPAYAPAPRAVQQPVQQYVQTIPATNSQIIQPARSSAGFSDTIIYASGAKNYYKKNEPIKIRLKLKRKAFIYFWTVSADGKGYLILPNNLESFNKYRAKVDYVVPERSAAYDFVSDRAGTEVIYVLATNKKIKTRKIKSIFSQKSGGIVPTATQKSIRSFVSKDIQVIARQQNLKYDIASFQISVTDPQMNGSTINININNR